jgi:hypothetical protein
VVATDLEPPLIDRARRWLREVEPNSAFEPAISLYALSAIRDDDPQTALEWAQRLQDEQRRHETLEKLARSWFANDPEAAWAWIEGSELPEAARKRALTPRRKPRRRGGGSDQRARIGPAFGSRRCSTTTRPRPSCFAPRSRAPWTAKGRL